MINISLKMEIMICCSRFSLTDMVNTTLLSCPTIRHTVFSQIQNQSQVIFCSSSDLQFFQSVSAFLCDMKNQAVYFKWSSLVSLKLLKCPEVRKEKNTACKSCHFKAIRESVQLLDVTERLKFKCSPVTANFKPSAMTLWSRWVLLRLFLIREYVLSM